MDMGRNNKKILIKAIKDLYLLSKATILYDIAPLYSSAFYVTVSRFILFFNFENISFPSCSSGAISLRYSFTPSPSHF